MQSPDSYNYTIDVFHKEAMSWMRQVAQTSQPFFLYLSYTVPHAGGWGDAPASPEQGNPVPTDMGYGHQPWPEVEKDHAAVISYLDDKVGARKKKLFMHYEIMKVSNKIRPLKHIESFWIASKSFSHGGPSLPGGRSGPLERFSPGGRCHEAAESIKD